jgi:hypothetical protein
MPHYLVEQTFADPLDLPANLESARWGETIFGNAALDGVTWRHSYITANRRRMYCFCDAPTPEAVRRAALRNGMPVDRITEVWALGL